MGRKAKPKKFSDLYKNHLDIFETAKNQLEKVFDERALEIGRLAIEAGLGDFGDNELLKIFSDVAKKSKGVN